VGYGGARAGKVRRKLWVVFLASLLPTSEPGTDKQDGCKEEATHAARAWGWGGVLRNMDSFVSMCVDVLTEAKNDTNGTAAPEADASFENYDSEEETIQGGQEQYDAKLNDNLASCQVAGADVRSFVRTQMDACCRFIGDAAWNEAVTERVEPVVLGQLAQLLN
jgi:hypothetical protein